MLGAARQVMSYVAGLTKEEFDQRQIVQDAVTRQMMIVGEAASRVSVAYQEAHPEIPWAQIIGMRHRLVHGYQLVDWTIIWTAATKEVPRLIELLERLMPRKDRSPATSDQRRVTRPYFAADAAPAKRAMISSACPTISANTSAAGRTSWIMPAPWPAGRNVRPGLMSPPRPM